MAKDGKDKTQDIKALVEENRRLHKELSIVKEEREILKNGNVLCAAPEVKYEFIKTNEANFSTN